MIGFKIIIVTSGDIQSFWRGMTEKAFGILFSQANEQGNCIIYLNEIDKLIPNKKNKKDTTDDGLIQGTGN